MIWIQAWVGVQDVLCPSSKHLRRLVGLGKLEKHGCGAHLYQGPCCRQTWQTGSSDLCSKCAFLKGQGGKGNKNIFPGSLAAMVWEVMSIPTISCTQLSLALGTELRVRALKVAVWGDLLSGTDLGSCCEALEFPDPQIKAMMMWSCWCLHPNLLV